MEKKNADIEKKDKEGRYDSEERQKGTQLLRRIQTGDGIPDTMAIVKINGSIHC